MNKLTAVKNDNVLNYQTRSDSKVHINYQRTNIRKFSVKYGGAKIWNTLPDNLKKTKDLTILLIVQLKTEYLAVIDSSSV